MNIEILVEQNPWWKDKDKIEEDYDIQKWKEKDMHWEPEIINKISIKPFSFHILIGPRQVGKTTTLKLFIRKMLKKLKPESIFYFSCDNIKDYKELLDLLETYFYFRNSINIEKSIIILDEITNVIEWHRAIKYLIDKGKLRYDVLIITGSTSLKIKREIELFPGRRGYGKDLILLPLSFREYLKITDFKLWKKIDPIKSLDDIEKKAVKAMIYLDELNKKLINYIKYGGFPISIKYPKERENAKQIYLNWIKNAILKSERNDVIAREIIKAIIEKMPSAISWEGISKEIEIKSPKTVSAYVDMFKNMFALIVLYNIDITGKIKFGKNKKIHIIDPLIFEIFEDWCLLDIKNKESIIAESLAAIHLNRYFQDKCFFLKNKNEVDILIKDKRKLYGFEVKWTEKKPVINKTPKIKSFVILSKKWFSKKPLTIPLSVFLSILE
ncbi:MAG: ATP-binding protein [Candidatus Aenigmarchaeota archaeon]|nr:ATP-binding protein [Candidatus Aenigmarchaeota archaeon]